MAHEEVPPTGGLVITRRVGQAFYLIVNGEPILVEIRKRYGGDILVAINADRKKVAVVRFENMRKEE